MYGGRGGLDYLDRAPKPSSKWDRNQAERKAFEDDIRLFVFTGKSLAGTATVHWITAILKKIFWFFFFVLIKKRST